MYGPHSNEELIREALHPYPDNLVIATKGGNLLAPEYSDMTALGNKWYLRQAAYMSMRRLGLEQIDLYYLHTAAFTDVPFEDAIQTLAEMKDDGLIRHIGLSNLSADQLRTAMSITDIAAVTVHYTVATRLALPSVRSPNKRALSSCPGTPPPSRAEPKANRSTRSSTPSRPATAPRPSRSRWPGSCTAPDAADPRHHQHRTPT